MIARVLLAAGVAKPAFWIGSQLADMALNPSFDIATQQPSELGCCDAHLPIIANIGFLATGACGVLGGVGLRSAYASSGATSFSRDSLASA
jgi:hypothetical membrane protein